MNFEMILIFFVIGILPVCVYLMRYPRQYSKLRGFVLGCISLLFLVVVYYLY